MKKTAPDGADRQTDRRHTGGYGDSMTESAQLGRFSENTQPCRPIDCFLDDHDIFIKKKLFAL